MAAALGAAVGLTVWASLAAGRSEELVTGIGTGAAALLALACLGRWPALLPGAIALLGAQYAASLLLRDDGIDALAPVYAAALVATAELAYWAVERGPASGERSIVVPRLAALLVLALGAACAGALVLAVSAGGGPGGLVLELAGVLAAAGTLALVARLAWQARS